MPKLKALEDLARALGQGGPFAPDQTYKTTEELVDALVDLGGKVHAQHDDYLGLKSDLPEDFLGATIEVASGKAFVEPCQRVLEEAKIIFDLLNEADDEDKIP